MTQRVESRRGALCHEVLYALENGLALVRSGRLMLDMRLPMRLVALSGCCVDAGGRWSEQHCPKIHRLLHLHIPKTGGKKTSDRARKKNSIRKMEIRFSGVLSTFSTHTDTHICHHQPFLPPSSTKDRHSRLSSYTIIHYFLQKSNLQAAAI